MTTKPERFLTMRGRTVTTWEAVNHEVWDNIRESEREMIVTKDGRTVLVRKVEVT